MSIRVSSCTSVLCLSHHCCYVISKHLYCLVDSFGWMLSPMMPIAPDTIVSMCPFSLYLTSHNMDIFQKVYFIWNIQGKSDCLWGKSRKVLTSNDSNQLRINHFLHQTINELTIAIAFHTFIVVCWMTFPDLHVICIRNIGLMCDGGFKMS